MNSLQFALQKPEWDRVAVQLDEGPAATEMVDGARDELLARSRLAEDEHTRIRGRHHGHQVQCLLQRGVSPTISPWHSRKSFAPPRSGTRRGSNASAGGRRVALRATQRISKRRAA